MNDFWLGFLALPAGAVAVTVALWIIASLWTAIETWWEMNGPQFWRAHRLPAGTIDEPRWIVGFRPLAGVFAAYALSPRRVSFNLLPRITVLIGYGRPITDDPTVRRALERKLGEIENLEVPYPKRRQ